MGKKVGWFSAVKRILNPEPKEKKDKKTHRSKGCFQKQKSQRLEFSPAESAGVNLTNAENEQAKQAYSVALATAAAAEAAVAAAHAAAEVVRLTATPHSPAKSKEEIAATKIQAAFRGYIARKAVKALKGLMRLKSLIEGHSVKRQAITTLKCMQTMSRVQAQIHARRIRMSEENQALQRHLQQKHEKELQKSRTSIGEDWDDRTQSKEQVQAKLQYKQEAAIRRERALAYAYTHQQTWRTSPRPGIHTFMDPHNPHWGWSWLDRWMAARPWEDKSATTKEPNSDPTFTKSGSTGRVQIRRNLHPDNKPSPQAKKQAPSPRRLSVSTPHGKSPSSSSAGRVKPPSPRRSVCSLDDDTRSMQSLKSTQYKRHSITGPSVRDDESQDSSSTIPSHMASTKAAKSRTGGPSLLSKDKGGTPDKDSASSMKKRLSFSGSPSSTRRHSGPPKVDTSYVKGKTGTTR